MAKANDLYRRHDQEALLRMSAQIEADPENSAELGSIFLYSAAARRKLADIAQAISFHMADTRERAGRPVPTAGYSGRKCNK